MIVKIYHLSLESHADHADTLTMNRVSGRMSYGTTRNRITGGMS